MTFQVLEGDCREVMPMLSEQVDSIVCDPPYGLSFMGKGWDHGVPGVDFWRIALEVAKPGAFLLAAGGTRTFHRLTCAIEDAGWEIRDCISWLYGSGFPKSLNIGNGFGTALKPAWEPFILARKPLIGTVAANVTEHGTGAMNIDGCRISTGAEDMGDPSRFLRSDANLNDGWQRPHKADAAKMSERATERFERTATLGRWPANVVLDEEAAALLDEQSGQLTSNSGTAFNRSDKKGTAAFGDFAGVPAMGYSGDKGGASRFFYTAKASRSERNAGLSGFVERKVHGPSGDGRVWDIPGSKSTARANFHPTVKPIELMRWLCRLVTPPAGLILDPFCGSGSTGCAAVVEGFRFIGIEKEPEYAEIARKRLAHWGMQSVLALDVDGAA